MRTRGLGVLLFAVLMLGAPAALAFAPGGFPAEGGTSDTTDLAQAAAESYSPEDAPDLQILNTSDAQGLLKRGDQIRYTITVSNVGGATAHGVAVYDALPHGTLPINLLPVMEGGTCTAIGISVGGEENYAVRCTRATLEPGASAMVTIDVEILPDAACGELDNVADVQARDEPAKNAGIDNVASHTDELGCSASLSLRKTGPSAVHFGDRVPYRFAVINDGDLRVYDVSVEDPSCDRTPQHTGGAVSLSPGRTWTFTCVQTVSATDGDQVGGWATAYAYDEGDRRATARDSHTADVLDPAIALEQTVTPKSGVPGTKVVYRIQITNTGDAALFDVVVTDEASGAVATLAQLAPGQTRVLKSPTTLPAVGVQVVNTATVRARDALGLAVADTDKAVVTIVSSGTSGGGGTPFTGGRVAGPGLAAALLAALGSASVAASRRRRIELEPAP